MKWKGNEKEEEGEGEREGDEVVPRNREKSRIGGEEPQANGVSVFAVLLDVVREGQLGWKRIGERERRER